MAEPLKFLSQLPSYLWEEELICGGTRRMPSGLCVFSKVHSHPSPHASVTLEADMYKSSMSLLPS